METTIRKANAEDLAPIRRLLESTLSGFLGNWKMIEAGQPRGEVTVLAEGPDVVAFCLGDHKSLAIFEVRGDRRGEGLGRKLAEAVLAEARASGSPGIEGFCMPVESLPFWTRVGFERVFDPGEEFRIAFPFPVSRPLPPAQPTCSLEFRLLMRERGELYRSRSLHALIDAGGYVLAEDYVEYVALGDMWLSIVRDGETVLYDGKCKNVGRVGGERKPPWVRVTRLTHCP